MYILYSRANIVAFFALTLGLAFPLNDPYCFHSAYDFRCKRASWLELAEMVKDNGVARRKIVGVLIAPREKTVQLDFSDGSKCEFLIRADENEMRKFLNATSISSIPVFTKECCEHWRNWAYLGKSLTAF